MAAVFTFRESRIMLFLFITCCLPMVGHVGLQSSSTTHPGFRDDPRCVVRNEDHNETVFEIFSATLSSHPPLSTFTPVVHASLHPSPSLYDSGMILLWNRPRNSIPFRPRLARSNSCILVAILLLCGDVEFNPGPSSPSSNLRFGYINICSAIHKAALIHEIISDHSLDVVALSETRFQSNMPNSILSDIAPDGFSVHHSFRSPTANHPAGGGLAFIHKNGINMQPVHPGIPQPSSFELQVLRITSCKPCVTLVNAYRPPDRSLATFLEEFQDVTSTILASTKDRVLICGDLNAPGHDDCSINPGLQDVIETLGLEQHVKSPTRNGPDHLLDLIITDQSLNVRDVRVVDSGFVSDHQLILASLNIIASGRTNHPVSFSYRPIKNIKPVRVRIQTS